MNVGMMWFNDNPKVPPATKVLEAADYYLTKYGQKPDLCLVSPAMYEQIQDKSSQKDSDELVEGKQGKIIIRALRSILPGHLWIGVDEKPSN
jgi:hypothetical protein